ncbi:MAG: ModE family transcriptional regulator, partial [Oscillospiraceae bacterium]|nr:ModE family transcriptional regulator [Oscillospiraceae bacterium]
MDRLHPALTVRLYTDKKCFGPGVAMLLRRVRTLRSLRAAAMDMDMAYSKAWSILRTAERELDMKLVRSTV